MAVNTISKTVYANHSAEQMFELVDRVEDYPRFLPWYGRTEVLSRQGNELRARLHMDYMGMRQSFATRNTNVQGREISMELMEGSFRSLHGIWQFTPLEDGRCKVDFRLQYELVGLLSRLISPVFGGVCNRLVEAFVQEADRRYA